VNPRLRRKRGRRHANLAAHEDWFLTGELQRPMSLWGVHRLAYCQDEATRTTIRRLITDYPDLVPPERLPLLERRAAGEFLKGGNLQTRDVLAYWAAHNIDGTDEIPGRWLLRWCRGD
jgi:hypothetical protein